MTFTFTAMGLLIAYLWVMVVATVIIAEEKVIEHKWGWALFYAAEAVFLTFLLLVR